MANVERVTIVAAVNDMDILRNNLLMSSGISDRRANQLIIKTGFRSASSAYNAAIDESENDLIIFIHQDVYLPEDWFPELYRCLEYLAERHINWGVLGCFGSSKDATDGLGRVYSTGLGVIGKSTITPVPVETLDEIVLIIRKSSGLRFDPSLPHFHLYGTDICMSAREKGLRSYAFTAFCIHNTNQLLELPVEFYSCYRHIKKRWNKFLPIYTPCIKISEFNAELYSRKLHEIGAKVLRTRRPPKIRIDNPMSLLEVLKTDKGLNA